MVFRQVESQNVEFKSSWRDEYLKVISAFANSDGGELRIGLMIMENQLELSMQKNCLRIFLIRLEIFWGIIPDVGIKAENGKEIIVITIKPSSVPISYHESFYGRSGSTNLELKGKELTRFLIPKSDKN